MSNIKETIDFYQSIGLTLLEIRYKQKRPFWDNWPRLTFEMSKAKMAKSKRKKKNIGILLGEQLAVLDVDDVDIAYELMGDYLTKFPLPESAPVCYRKTNGRTVDGVRNFKDKGHIYFRRQPFITSSIGLKQLGFELRTGRQQCATYPSIHPDGDQYIWDDIEKLRSIPLFPKELYEYILEKKNSISVLPDYGATANRCKIKIREHSDLKDTFITADGAEMKRTDEFNHFIEQIGNQVSMHDIASYVGLEQPARSFSRKHYFCPRGHDTKTPSFAIWDKTNTGKCFGCGLSVGPIGLVMLMQNLKMTEACEYIANAFGLVLPKRKYMVISESTEFKFDDPGEDDDVAENFKSPEVDYTGIIPALPKSPDEEIAEACKTYMKTHDVIVGEATQGTGKSYNFCILAVERILEGKSSVYATRSHDELDQVNKTLLEFFSKESLDPAMIVHLRGRKAVSGEEASKGGMALPKKGPVIIIAPHAYLLARANTPYHYPIIEAIRKQYYGPDLIVVIDEICSAIDTLFFSFTLGGRFSQRVIHGYTLLSRNRRCPMQSKSGNCSNCTFKPTMVPKKTPGGLSFYPLNSHQPNDVITGEVPEILSSLIMDDIKNYRIEDKTMVLSYIPYDRKTLMKDRVWSTGEKNETQLPVGLNPFISDMLIRLVSPHLIEHWPYDKAKEEPLYRCLNDEEIEARKAEHNSEYNNIVFPNQPCKVPFLQGWDSFPFEAMKNPDGGYFCKIIMLGPRLSMPQKLYLQEVFGDDLLSFKKDSPYKQMKKVMVLSYEDRFSFSKKSVKNFMKEVTDIKSALYFAKTKGEAEIIAEGISSFIPTVFYNGEEHIRFADMSKTLDYKIYMTYAYGPISQGIRRHEKLVFVDTQLEIPKFVYRGGIIYREYQEQILDHIQNLACQCAGRIMREVPDEKDDAEQPRVIVLFGKHAEITAQFLTQFFASSGHGMTHVHCDKNLDYLKVMIKRWLTKQNVEQLLSTTPQEYILMQIQETIMEKHRAAEENKDELLWKHIRRLKMITALSDIEKNYIKKWYRDFLKKKTIKKESTI